MQRSTSEKFNIINRQTEIISELPTTGLEAISKIIKIKRTTINPSMR
ncbi:hypothetical protein [Pedobacter ginsengisoli]|nr:hypothetical protein [Pedobacter ginsengisoli]